MTVTITQNVADIGGVSDNTVFVFRSPTTRLSSSGSTVISTRQVRAKPVAGVLTVVLEPGPATVTWDGMGKVGFTVPTSNSDLWSLIAAGIAFPPDTSAAAVAAAVDAYLAGASFDVLREYANLAAFPATGAVRTIYVALDTGKFYRWNVSSYVEVSPPVVTSVASRTGAVTLTSADVGLGNVDNTSNATERAATATLTNKTLTSPVVNTPTGIVKGDVGLGSVDNTADASKPVSTAQAAADTAVLTTATGRAIAFAVALG